MSVFEEVFTKRGCEESTEDTSASAFEGVFARRGRWRKQPAVGASQSNIDAAHQDHVASELPSVDEASAMIETAELKFHNDSKTVSENSLQIHGVCAQGCKSNETSALAMHEGSQFVVKNTFFTTEGLEYDSLKDFLQDRKAFSCPANMLDIETLCSNDGDNAVVSAFDEIVFKTSSTMADFKQEDSLRGFAAPRACSWNTASTFMDLERLHSIDEMLDPTAPVSATVLSLAARCEPEESDVAPPSHQQIGTNDSLSTLRMIGSAIQEQLSQAATHVADRQMMQTASGLVTAAPDLGFQANAWMPSCCEAQASFPQRMPVMPNAERMPVLLRPEASPPPPPAAVPPPPLGAAPAPAGALRLAEAIAPPELGSRQLPSIGSMLHHKGECRPCTFYHTRGCENKEDCQFCHLCGPSEKKKRLRALKRAQREAELAAQQADEEAPIGWVAGEANTDADMIVE